MKVVVITPTYNEKENIVKLIPVLENDIFPKIKNHDMNILVADDDSPDGTANEVKRLMEKWKNIDINNGEKRGLGAAYVRAMTYAIDHGAEIMFEMDADLQHDPEKIPEFLKKIDDGCDMVIGNRYSNGGSIPKNWPLPRKIFSIVANLFVRTIFMKFSVHDWTGGYRALRKEVFLKERDELTNYKGYIFQISFLHKAIRDGFKIGEVPFHFSDRTLGKSKIAPLGYIIEVFKFVILTRIEEFQRVIKFLIVGGTGFIIQTALYWFLVNNTSLLLGVANFLSAQLAIFSNYNLNNIWTFHERKAGSTASYLIKMIGFFATSNIGVIVIQSGLVQLGELLFGRIGLRPFIYYVFATAVLTVYNFTVYNKIIWRKKPH